jgi:protein ImuB
MEQAAPPPHVIRRTSSRVRALNRPRPLKVDAGEDGRPGALYVSGHRVEVESVLEIWRIDDEWWRARPVSRLYFRVALADGRVTDVYRALASGRWYQQAYG